MIKIREDILSQLQNLGLSNLEGRPYDCSFELLAAPKERKRLIMVGFNGSSADKEQTNAKAIQDSFHEPQLSNIQNGLNGAWGPKTLANRLKSLTECLGFDVQSTIYTNALLLCSQNAYEIKRAAEGKILGDLKGLIDSSMKFFSEVTIPLSQPELIVAYSNGLSSLSATKILLDTFGLKDTFHEEQSSSYYTTYSFLARFGDLHVPVVGIRHMSRFKPKTDLVKSAWKVQSGKLQQLGG